MGVEDLLTQRARGWLAAGKSLAVEFKSEHRKPLNDRDLVEAVVCLANGSGGVLLVGVEDDGTPSGARPRHEGGRTDTLRVQALIANQTQPPVPVTAHLVGVDDTEVLVIEVPNSPRVVGTTQGVYVRRALGGDGRPMCVPYHAHEMLANQIEIGAVDFASIPARGATWDDLDPLEFERVRNLTSAANGRADQLLVGMADRDIAHALGLVRPDAEVSLGALLIFGRPDALRRFVPTHEAAFQVMDGLAVVTNDFLRFPLLRVAEEMLARFKARNREEELQFGLFRMAVPTYSETAFREALANALTHRDYTQRGAIHVQWSDEQLEISSPGGFPEGIRQDNLLVAPPSPRSPLLADAFKRTGLVERTGRGINRMFADQLRVGRPAPDYGRSTDRHVVAVLPGGPANLAMTRWVFDQEQASGKPLTLSALQVLSELLRERRATTGELAQLTQRTEAEARDQLTRMVEQGWLQARGEGKGRTWHLSAAVYRALDSSSGYVRVRGFEPLQQEHMVLSFVSAHGRITRGQAAELCGLSPGQASRLLQRLAADGKLVLRGQRRGAHYERSS